ncbi:MAG: hypothetical protein RLY70_1744, partial [Planctomycetota bacterium]
ESAVGAEVDMGKKLSGDKKTRRLTFIS